MTLFRWSDNWDPFIGIRHMQREFDRVINRSVIDGKKSVGGGVFPPVNVCNGNNEIVVECEMPGVKKSDIALTVTGETLVVKGVKLPHGDETKVQFYRRECGSGDFSRTIVLPDKIDAENIEASMDCGILVVRIPKSESASPKQINVS